MANLPEYDFPDISGDVIEQYGQLDTILNKAGKLGIVNNLEEREPNYSANNQIRLQTVASRLYLLGYLRHKYVPHRIHLHLSKIQTAILAFHEEASIEEPFVSENEFFIGEETWYMLDELVSFESSFNKEFWFSGDQINPTRVRAMHRAIQLRLWSLGLCSEKPKGDITFLSKRIFANFTKVLAIFSVENQNTQKPFNWDLINLLFDQDAITNIISEVSSKDKTKFLLRNQQAPQNKQLAEKFIVNVAKIELWLLGFEVKIDGKNNYSRRESDRSGKKKNGVSEAMKKYYQTFGGKSEREAKKMARIISPQFFVQIASVNSMDDDNKGDASSYILTEIRTQNEIDKAWGYLKKKGMRLWDGLKRIWRWVKRAGKKVVSYIKNNIYKGFYRIASKSYKIVKNGINEVIRSINVYVKGILNTNETVFGFSKDLDTLVFIPMGASQKGKEEAIQKLRTQTKAFSVACRMLRWILMIIITLSLSFYGWAKLLYSLVKSYSELKLLYKDFKELATS